MPQPRDLRQMVYLHTFADHAEDESVIFSRAVPVVVHAGVVGGGHIPVSDPPAGLFQRSSERECSDGDLMWVVVVPRFAVGPREGVGAPDYREPRVYEVHACFLDRVT